MLMTLVCLIIGLVYSSFAETITGEILRRIENDNCILILRCSAKQFPAKSKGGCVLLATTMDSSSGSHYDVDTCLCNIYTPNTTLTGLNSDRGYYTKGN